MLEEQGGGSERRRPPALASNTSWYCPCIGKGYLFVKETKAMRVWLAVLTFGLTLALLPVYAIPAAADVSHPAKKLAPPAAPQKRVKG